MRHLLALAALVSLATAVACSDAGTTAHDDPGIDPGAPPAAHEGDEDDEDPELGSVISEHEEETGEDLDGGTDAAGPADAGPPPPKVALPEKGAGLDPNGVLMIRPSKSGGASFHLGAQNPNTAARFEIERGTVATAKTEGKIRFWNLPSHPLNYASGGTGYTSRLHISATGTTQRYTWRDTPGYLGAPNDLKNQELTVYARAHTLLDAKRAAFTLKVRGGRHTAANADLSSCTMMNLAGPQTSGVARFGKELSHPKHDYVKLVPKVATQLKDNTWVALKLVTYQRDATHVVYRLYVDTAPFDAAGKPANRFFLFSEYVDTANKSTGTYSRMANWGGMLTSFRSDGLKSVDFALVSVREIVPGT